MSDESVSGKIAVTLEGVQATALAGNVTVTTQSYTSLQVDLITPEKTFFSGAASMIVVPGVWGDFGALPGHAPFISAIRPGVIIIDGEDGTQRKIAVMGGFAEVVPERCTVLAEVAVDCANISATDAEARLDEARLALGAIENDEERPLAEKKLALAEAIAQAI